jgi:hypothetical protein
MPLDLRKLRFSGAAINNYPEAAPPIDYLLSFQFSLIIAQRS